MWGMGLRLGAKAGEIGDCIRSWPFLSAQVAAMDAEAQEAQQHVVGSDNEELTQPPAASSVNEELTPPPAKRPRKQKESDVLMWELCTAIGEPMNEDASKCARSSSWHAQVTAL
jgi:hypothetical protein